MINGGLAMDITRKVGPADGRGISGHGHAGIWVALALVLVSGGCSRIEEAGKLFAEAMAPENAGSQGDESASAPGSSDVSDNAADRPGGAPVDQPAEGQPGTATDAVPGGSNPGASPAETPKTPGETPGTEVPAENPGTGAPVPTPEVPGALPDAPVPLVKPVPPTEPVERPEPVPQPQNPAPPPAPQPAPEPAPAPAPGAPPPAPVVQLPVVFRYHPPGELLPGSGTGSISVMNFAPDMRFPIASHPAFPGSQVYRPGGGLGPKDKPDQCDISNFSDPWQDNFCEKRTRDTTNPFCAAKGVHLGQDIRAGDPGLCRKILRTPRAERRDIPVVAVEDGIISNIGSYSVTLRTERNSYRYLHLNMAALAVKNNQDVKAGDLIGFLSNDFGVDSAGKPIPTTLHLHFEIRANTESNGWATVPPYPALVAAYGRREMGRGEEITAKAGPSGN